MLASLKVKRCVKPGDFDAPIYRELDHFADAGKEGYGTVTYIRLKTAGTMLVLLFYWAKARVTPLKSLTN